jgi:hypothetical protein
MKKLIYAGLTTSVLIAGYLFFNTTTPLENYSSEQENSSVPTSEQISVQQSNNVPSNPVLPLSATTNELSSVTETPDVAEEQSLDEGETPSAHSSDNTEASIPSLKFSEVDNNEPADATPVDAVFAKSGTRFNVDLDKVANMHSGENLTIEFLGQSFDASIKEISKTDRFNRYVEIKLNRNSDLADMTVYYGRKVTKGVLYTNKGVYMFQHDGKTGYLLSEEEFEKKTGIADKTESPRYNDRNAI